MFGFSKRKAERTFTDFAVGFNLKNHPHLIPVGYADDEVIFWDYEKVKNLFIIGGRLCLCRNDELVVSTAQVLCKAERLRDRRAGDIGVHDADFIAFSRELDCEDRCNK